MSTADHPASDQQTLYWFQHLLAGDRPVFNDPFVGRLRGALSLPAVRAAVADIVARHEVLRTTFRSADGRLWQRVHDDVSVPVDGPLAVGSEQEALRLVERACARPFRLDTEPPLRVTLYRIGPRDHLALFLFHHIATDAWTIELLLNEWADRYARHDKGAADPPGPAGQYREYAAWQCDAPEVDAALDYWCDRLRGATVTELPPAPTSPGAATRQARAWHTAPAGLAAACAGFARTRHASPFMVYLAGFLTVLHQITGQRDLLIGLNAANRARPGDAGIAGPFLNMLPLRVVVEPAAEFDHLVRVVRDQVLAAYAHEHVRFGDLVAALRRTDVWPARLAAMPVTFTAVAPPSYPTAAGRLHCHWRIAPFDPGGSATGMVVVLGGEPAGRGVSVEFDQRHDAGQVDELVAAWWRVLADGVVA